MELQLELLPAEGSCVNWTHEAGIRFSRDVFSHASVKIGDIGTPAT